MGQVAQQDGRKEQQQSNAHRAHHSCYLGPRSSRFSHRGTRRTTAHGEPLEKASRQVGRPKRDQFLVVIGFLPDTEGKRPGEHAGFGEGH